MNTIDRINQLTRERLELYRKASNGLRAQDAWPATAVAMAPYHARSPRHLSEDRQSMTLPLCSLGSNEPQSERQSLGRSRRDAASLDATSSP